MAAGSQAEKGICALLVKAAVITKRDTIVREIKSPPKDHTEKLKSPRATNQAIESNTHTSPTRFDKTVIIPALLDFFEG